MRKLILPTVLLTLSNVLTKAVVLLFYIVLAWALPVAEYGYYRYLIAISLMIGIAFSGLPIALCRFIGADPTDSKEIAEYVTNTLFIMLIIFLASIFAILIFSSQPLYLSLFLFAAFVDTFYMGFTRGLLNYVKISGYRLIENVLQLAILAVSFYIYRKVDFTFAVIFFSISGFLSLVIFESIRRQITIVLKISLKRIKELAAYALPVTVGSVGWTMLFSTNILLIGYFYDVSHVGYYTVGITIAQGFSFLPAAISTIVLPKAAFVKDKSALVFPVTIAALTSLSASLMGFVILLFFQRQLLIFLFSEKYLPALSVIVPLSIGQILIEIHQIYSSVWQGLNRPWVPSLIILCAAAFNLASGYFLIRQSGIYGAAISSMLSSLIALILITLIYYTQWKTLLKG